MGPPIDPVVVVVADPTAISEDKAKVSPSLNDVKTASQDEDKTSPFRPPVLASSATVFNIYPEDDEDMQIQFRNAVSHVAKRTKHSFNSHPPRFATTSQQKDTSQNDTSGNVNQTDSSSGVNEKSRSEASAQPDYDLRKPASHDVLRSSTVVPSEMSQNHSFYQQRQQPLMNNSYYPYHQYGHIPYPYYMQHQQQQYQQPLNPIYPQPHNLHPPFFAANQYPNYWNTAYHNGPHITYNQTSTSYNQPSKTQNQSSTIYNQTSLYNAQSEPNEQSNRHRAIMPPAHLRTNGSGASNDVTRDSQLNGKGRKTPTSRQDPLKNQQHAVLKSPVIGDDKNTKETAAKFTEMSSNGRKVKVVPESQVHPISGFSVHQLRRFHVAFAFRDDNKHEEKAALEAQTFLTAPSENVDNPSNPRYLTKNERESYINGQVMRSMMKENNENRNGAERVSRIAPTKILVGKKQAPEFPPGWIVETFDRPHDPNRVDSYWFSPQTKKRFRSRAEVRRFLALLPYHGGDEEAAYLAWKRKEPSRRRNSALPKKSKII